MARPIRLYSHVGSREHYNNTTILVNLPDLTAQFEYVILDENERQYLPVVTKDLFDKFYRNPQYQRVFAEQNAFIFHRLGGESDWKVQAP